MYYFFFFNYKVYELKLKLSNILVVELDCKLFKKLGLLFGLDWRVNWGFVWVDYFIKIR